MWLFFLLGKCSIRQNKKHKILKFSKKKLQILVDWSLHACSVSSVTLVPRWPPRFLVRREPL